MHSCGWIQLYTFLLLSQGHVNFSSSVIVQRDLDHLEMQTITWSLIFVDDLIRLDEPEGTNILVNLERHLCSSQ